jgi:hypothetical protein
VNDQTAARLVAELSLREDRPLGEELRQVHPEAATAAAAGRLSAALALLGYDVPLRRLAERWPAALRGAREQLSRLPSAETLQVPLVQAGLWLGLISLVQVMVLAVLRTKVLPVLVHMAPELRPSFLYFVQDLGDVAGPLLACGLMGLFAVGLLGATGPAWLPGWGRHLRRAQEAAMSAALISAQAPADVVSAWLRETKTLHQHAVAPVAEDLLAIAGSAGQRAEHAMARFVTFFRYAGFGLLTLVAVAITLDVYGLCSSLAGVR